MLKILVVAKHVFRESLRKKILFVLGIFFLILLVSSLFLEGISPEDRVKLMMRVSFGSLAFFGVMMAIFLAATSLPGEVEERLIQVVMTKPVGRFNFLLGKILGFLAVIALILTLMGTLSWALVQITARGKPLYAERWFSPQSLTFLGEDGERVKFLEEAAQAGRISWVRGLQDIRAIWRWEGLRGDLFQGEATFRVTDVTPAGLFRQTTEMELRVYSPLGVVKVQEIVVEDGEPAFFEFEPGETEGGFRVEVRRLNPDFDIGVEKESLKILAPPGSFHFNFAKCLLLLFFKLTLIVVIAVMGSTFLSAAVTITFSLFVYLTGHMIEFLKGVLATIVALGVLVAPCCPGCPGKEPAHPWLMGVFEFFLRWFTELFPNLRRFGGSGFLIEGVDIPLSLLRGSLLYMSIYVALALAIAYLVFRRKEFR